MDLFPWWMCTESMGNISMHSHKLLAFTKKGVMDDVERWRGLIYHNQSAFFLKVRTFCRVHLRFWFCLCAIHRHNGTVTLGNGVQIHWLHCSQGNTQYFTATKQFSVCIGKPYDYHGEQYWHILLSSLKEILKRAGLLKDGEDGFAILPYY